MSLYHNFFQHLIFASPPHSLKTYISLLWIPTISYLTSFCLFTSPWLDWMFFKGKISIFHFCTHFWAQHSCRTIGISAEMGQNTWTEKWDKAGWINKARWGDWALLSKTGANYYFLIFFTLHENPTFRKKKLWAHSPRGRALHY